MSGHLMGRCDECGRFVREARDVYGVIREDGPSHGACRDCRPELFKEENE